MRSPGRRQDGKEAFREAVIDLIIKNGEIVDGPGAPDSAIVRPGFADIHTHYDGQVSWSAMLAPASINGVTSAITGNCPVGFAPARPDKHDFLIRLLEGVEGLSGAALHEGLKWDSGETPDRLLCGLQAV